jgi:hypothetical protein
MSEFAPGDAARTDSTSFRWLKFSVNSNERPPGGIREVTNALNGSPVFIREGTSPLECLMWVH